MSRKAVDYFHPSVTFIYSLSLAMMAMLFFNPIFIALGLFFAIIQNLLINGGKQLLKQLKWGLPFSLIVALFNPLISHGGKTLLFYFWGNPVTLEATFYGLCSGGVLLLIFLWFGVYNRLVTPDRFMYLFSRIIPAASMLVTMTQRMIPLFSRRLSEIHRAQKTLLRSDLELQKKHTFSIFSIKPFFASLKSRMSQGLDELSILLSWSMEEGLDTADSMKARGYGTGHRSSFSIYRFTRRDFFSLVFIAICDFCCATAYFLSVTFRFYPQIYMSAMNLGGVISIATFIVLSMTLPIVEAHWVLMWKISSRNIKSATQFF